MSDRSDNCEWPSPSTIEGAVLDAVFEYAKAYVRYHRLQNEQTIRDEVAAWDEVRDTVRWSVSKRGTADELTALRTQLSQASEANHWFGRPTIKETAAALRKMAGEEAVSPDAHDEASHD